MLTMEGLKKYGADTDAGMTRCMNNEQFYFRLIGMALNSDGYQLLEEAIKKGDLTAAFETAHALKGVLSNLSLDPMLKPVAEMTELLRSRIQTDYSPYLSELLAQKEALRQLQDA